MPNGTFTSPLEQFNPSKVKKEQWIQEQTSRGPSPWCSLFLEVVSLYLKVGVFDLSTVTKTLIYRGPFIWSDPCPRLTPPTGGRTVD